MTPLSAGTVVQGTNSVGGSHTYTAAGVYTVKLTVTDQNGVAGSNSAQATATDFVVIYDPSAGFVTGGGWIDSPEGAYTPDNPDDPDITGKANFGFVSKYKKGASTPTGQTEFNFKAGDLNFHSASYDWLVIAGAKAMYKGDGTVNGAAGFTFQLNAIDGQVNGGGGVDKFRIKIKEGGGGKIYDNQPGAGDNDDPITALGGGSIKIHKGSSKTAANDTQQELLSETIPESYGLEQNYPNPFNPDTEIYFQLPEANHVVVAIFNTRGQEIRRLIDGKYAAGYHTLIWDAKDNQGNPVSSGVYLYQLRTANFSQVRKMSLLR